MTNYEREQKMQALLKLAECAKLAGDIDILRKSLAQIFELMTPEEFRDCLADVA